MIMKKVLIALFLTSGVVNVTHADPPPKLTIPTSINAHQFLDDLSIDELLTIASVGKLKALTVRTDIQTKLALLEAEIDTAFKRFCEECIAQEYLSENQLSTIEVEFKQKMVLALYALLYAELQNRIAAQGTEAEKIIFDTQLSPEELTTLVS